MKIPLCMAPYLRATLQGDRNTNLFTAMKQIKYLNPHSSFDDLHRTALLLNKHLMNPLNARECRTIATSVLKHNYKGTCIPFRKHCNRSGNCGRNKPYNTIRKDLWKQVNTRNELKILHNEGVKAYPWDIEDADKLTPEQAERVMELREFKGINPMINKVLKLRHVEIGDEALKSWNKHRGVINGT